MLRPGDDGYDAARSAWNLNAIQHPAVIVMAESAADVQGAVRLARAEDLGIGVMATGHGVSVPADGGLLINTSRMTGTDIDPAARSARVQAGTKWIDVISAAATHGFATLPGSSPHVGVVGYTMGGGFGWLGRKYGFAADHVTAAEVVTADGDLVTASAQENADLLWGLKGGAGNFGIVTTLEFGLLPVDNVYAGNLYYPVGRAREVLECYADWTKALPDEMAAAVSFRNFPPFPTVPEDLRGESLITVRACYCGADLGEGERLIGYVRDALGEPEIDTYAVMPAAKLDMISMDPVEPVGSLNHAALLDDLSKDTIDALVELGSDSTLLILEMRHLRGALSTTSSALSPIGHSDARFTMNAIGASMTPEMAADVRSYLAQVAETIRPHTTGGMYVNFLDVNNMSPERMRAAYTADDWDRLVELKTRFDPDNLFRFNRNIPPTPAGRSP